MTPDPGDYGREAHQLPPGRHGLSRDYVVSNQRERILDAVVDVVGLAGFQALRVEDICVTAGVSRRTFYDHFKSKDEAFLASYDAVVSRLEEAVEESFEQASGFPEAVHACLGTFLDFIASEPRYADMCIVEVLAAGPEALERRKQAMSHFAELIGRGAKMLPKGPRPPALTAETVIGGIYEVVYARVLRGETEQLPSLKSDLAFAIMLPFLGHEQALRESQAAPASR